MTLFYILLLTFLIEQSKQVCKKYICQTITQPGGGQTRCQLYDTPTTTMSLQSCPSLTQTCVKQDASNWNCVETSSIAAATYKKEFSVACSTNSDCASNVCTTNTCAVISVGNACTQNYNCDKNHLCISNVCTVAVAANADCSSNVNSCQYGTYCASTDGTTYSCVKQYSVDAGTDIKLHGSVSGSNDQKFILLQSLCKSSYGNYRTSSTFNCWEKGETTTDYPKSCNTDADCLGSLGNKGLCECDVDNFHTKDGKGKCQGFVNDYQNLLKAKSDLAATNYATTCYPYQIEYSASGAQQSSSCAIIDDKCQYDDCIPQVHENHENCFASVGLHSDIIKHEEYKTDNFFIYSVIAFTVYFMLLMMSLHNAAIRPTIKGTGFFEE